MLRTRTHALFAVSAVVSALQGCADVGEMEAPDKADVESRQGAALLFGGVTENPWARSGDWPSAGHDWAHSGHNPRENTISTANVAQLSVKWGHEFGLTPGQRISVVGTAVTAGGVAYFADGAGFLHAKDLVTGNYVWPNGPTYLGFLGPASPDPVFNSVVLSAPVVTDDAVYVGDSDARITKVNRLTGAPVWQRQVDANPNANIQSDLATVGPFVVFGVASFENAFIDPQDLTMRGSVAALHQDDGSLAWQLFTTSDQTLPAPKFGAGVGVWSSPAIDFFGNRVFIGTGQYYEPGSANPSQPSKKDKDLSDSLLSIRLSDGKLDDARQFTSGDVFGERYPAGPDADVGTPPNLFTIAKRNHRGSVVGFRQVVGAGDKTGKYYVMDRDNLKPIWETRVSDGSRIGGFQSTAAVADGVVYVASHEGIYGGSLDGYIPEGADSRYLTTEEGGYLITKLSRTQIKALDAETGDVLWQTTTYGAITFAPLIIANGVLYHGDVNGAVRGFDAATGAQLWQTQLGGFPDGQGGFLAGNTVLAMSIAKGRLLVTSTPILPNSPSTVTAFGL